MHEHVCKSYKERKANQNDMQLVKKQDSSKFKFSERASERAKERYVYMF